MYIIIKIYKQTRRTIIFLAFDFCRFCVVIRFSSPPQRPMTSDFEGYSIPEFIHYIYFPILILEKEPEFSLFNVECQTVEIPYFLAARSVGVELILWMEAWLNTRPNPRTMLPKNKFQNVWRIVGSGSKLK